MGNNKPVIGGQSLLETLRESAGEKRLALTASELMCHGHIQMDDQKRIKELFLLIHNKMLRTDFHPKLQQEVIVVHLKENESYETPEQDDLSTLIQCLFLYLQLSKSPTIARFHNLTKNKFKKHVLLKQGASAGFTTIEWKILTSTIIGYLTGFHPVYLNNMKLSPIELAGYSLTINENKSRLVNLNMINQTSDSDGINYRIALNRNSLHWILNKPAADNYYSNTIKCTFGKVLFQKDLIVPKMVYSTRVDKSFRALVKMIELECHEPNFNASVILHGPSGTGKTGFVKQIAKILKADIFQLDFSIIQSKWIGETEKNIRTAFEEYQVARNSNSHPIILLMNEADGLMNKRVPLHNSTDVYSNHAQTQLLEILETFNGILFATTNLIGNLDDAFNRRFIFKCKIDMPDDIAKAKLWINSPLSEMVHKDRHDQILAENWTAAQLEIVEQNVRLFSRIETLNQEDILLMLQEEGMLAKEHRIGFNLKFNQL